MKKLNKKELQAQNNYLSKLKVVKRKTKKLVVVAMVGLVGSGKSHVAREISNKIGAVVITMDFIRTELRKQKQSFDNLDQIVKNITFELTEKDCNIVFDSDFVRADKRKELLKFTQKNKIKTHFVRTYCDTDVFLGRAIGFKPEEFFEKASTNWKGKNTGSVVKIREMWRRTPHNYRWENKKGGHWILRKLPFKLDAEINTTDGKTWKKDVEKLTKKITNR